MDRKALAAAFPVTVPVLMGYLAIGMAFGFMLQDIGYNFIWAFFMSLTIYAGSGQYLGVSLLAAAASLGTVALMTLLINFRHLVYGLSMLEKFRGMGWRKFYMIFSLTDETYALLSSAQAPVGVNPKNFYFAIALLDQSYWILGSVIGAVAPGKRKNCCNCTGRGWYRLSRRLPTVRSPPDSAFRWTAWLRMAFY